MRRQGGLARHSSQSEGGFTLMELLVVTVIIAILATMITAALWVAMKNAQRKQEQVQIDTLTAALETYRHEYGLWPGHLESGWGHAGSHTVVADNYRIVEYLVRPEGNSDKNKRRIQFLNLSEYLTNRVGSVISPVSKSPYGITINMDEDRCSVTNSP